jgi:hypothetical protein
MPLDATSGNPQAMQDSFRDKLTRIPQFFWPLLFVMVYFAISLSLARPDLSNDSRAYFSYARNLVDTGVYGDAPGLPDMAREPGYGAFLAVLLFAFDHVQSFTGWIGTSTESALMWVVFWQILLSVLAFALMAFKSGLPARYRWPIFLVSLLSPTLWGASTVIYSETLVISLMAIFMFFAFRAFTGKTRFWRNAIGAGGAWGAIVLTKGYLEYTIPVALLAGLILAGLKWRRGSEEESRARLRKWLLAVALVSSLFAGGWSVRNRAVLGDQRSSRRMLNAIAGKVLRVQKFNMPKELTTALAAAVGTNFCNDIYGKSACFLYTIDGADSIGFPLSDRYYRIFSAPALAQSAMVKDMAQEYLKNQFF